MQILKGIYWENRLKRIDIIIIDYIDIIIDDFLIAISFQD